MAKVLPMIFKIKKNEYYTSSSDSDNEQSAKEKERKSKNPSLSVSGKKNYIEMRNELKENIVQEVLKEVLPDIGEYDVDGMMQPKVQKKSKLITILKFFNLYPLSLHEIIMTGDLVMLNQFITRKVFGKKPKDQNPKLINQFDDLGRTPLILAVKIKKEDFVYVLIKRNAIVDACEMSTCLTPFMFSVLQNTPIISKLLISSKANINLCDIKCISPLMIACGNNDIEHCDMILTQQPEYDAQDENGWTALHYAANGNSPKCIIMLLQIGANRNIKDHKKRKAVHMARFKNHGECVAVLEDMKNELSNLR